MESVVSHKRRLNRQRRMSGRRLILVGAVVTLVVLSVIFLLSTRSAQVPTPARNTASALLFPPYPRVMPPPPAEPVARSADHTDVKTEFVTIAKEASATLCPHWISGVLTGVQMTTAGWGDKKVKTIDKLSLLKNTMALKGMRDWDVLVYLSPTTMFTGVDFQPFLNDFIARSPSHPADIDVRAIRRGEKVAPVRFAAAPSCESVGTLSNATFCEASYAAVEAAVEARAAQDQFQYMPQVNASSWRSSYLFLDSGFFIGRVWALKELATAEERFLRMMRKTGVECESEQAVATALYLDMRWEEVSLGLLAQNPPNSIQSSLNQFGMHYGTIDLWYANAPLILAHRVGIPGGRIDASLYGFPFQTPMYPCAVRACKPEVTIRGIMHAITTPERFLYDAPVRYDHELNVKAVRLAPSLIGANPRLIDKTSMGDYRSPFPSFVDVPVAEFVYCRPEVAQFLGWYIALDLVPGQRTASANIARTAKVNVVRTGSHKVTQLSLGELCPAWIADYIVNGARGF